MKKLNTIDLFAGAGGLSLGFVRTGCFNIIAAVEYDRYAAQTYAENHEGVDVLREDASKISFKEKIETKYGKVDIVIGGPPCQGFSNANRQKSNLISGNNQLVQHYVRAIEELDPIAFVLENVKTLESKKHFFFVDSSNIDEVNQLGIPTKKEKINLCGENETAAMIAGVFPYMADLDLYRIKKEGYSLLCTLLKFSRTRERAEKYFKDQEKRIDKLFKDWEHLHSAFWNEQWEHFFRDAKEILQRFGFEREEYSIYFDRLKTLVEVEQAIERLSELNENHIDFEIQVSDSRITVIADTFTVKDYLDCKFKALGYDCNKAILNAADFGVPQTRERFIRIGIKKEIANGKEVKLPSPILKENDYNTVRDAIEDLEELDASIDAEAPPIHALLKEGSKLAALLYDEDIICNHVATDTGEVAKKRFEALAQGENFHNLNKALKTTYSLPERTQNTIYLRLQYDEPSGTVMNVRKSMWIHPILNRALSIREAARLQSFPNSFVFHGSKNSQYQQVGNAVPPLLGQAIAECLLEQLEIKSASSLANDLGVATTSTHMEREDDHIA
ncbi:DNA (cytosine-5)-methyltransferase 1 [Sporobacter termitidis DSM 10068]|uniref:DNA (cytosine-5-)-methyltransferase n=1 Tax=Sporobacter termitidis DSM 10068 TaxID=1123282 RepID=A0A1M5U1S6_9FIRM|nr:DNA cytosine methyltransferase [Sporobacter termitidis]SHH56811.1 DNA (cytosine-5)-methyltransferase 1 [Sporobacter termitidis DSM 10068]